MMIIVVAKNQIKQGKAEEFKATVKELIDESRKEKGCISYGLYEDCGDSNILTFIEEWESEEAIKLHNNSIHYTTIIPKLAEFREGNKEINLYKLA